MRALETASSRATKARATGNGPRRVHPRGCRFGILGPSSRPRGASPAMEEITIARGRRGVRPVRRARTFDPPARRNARGLSRETCIQDPGPDRGSFVSGASLMPATVIVGLQWGDEGKGKTTDFLAEHVAVVVRYQGGDNAGHTVVVGDETLKLQLCPSGVLYPHITSVIGNGVVVNPATLIAELDMLAAKGIDVSRVRVSRSAHVIMPYHVALDRANEVRLGGAKVGTTGRGIGPAYGDRAWRLGLRMEDLCDREVLRERIGRALPDKNLLLDAMGAAGFTVDALVEQAAAWGARLAPHLDDTTWLVQDALRRGDHVLLEGAQGTLLDLDHGSYPFVTSSNPVAGGACTGGGIGPLQVDEVIGVMKAYSTRVGAGPFPTELFDDIGKGIAERGREFGTVTGRPRRVGWFDAVPMRYAVAVNSNTRDRPQQARHPVRHRDDPAVRGLRDRRQARGGLAVERQRALAGDADLRGLPGLGAADPRRPQPVRPARERPPLRVGARGPRRASRSCSSPSAPSGPRPSSGRGGRSGTARRRRPDRVRSPR